MLEILLLIYLGKRIGTMLRAKGRSAGWMQALLVVCWFGGEVAGAVTMILLFGVSDGSAYLGALIGAACGAAVVFIIANSMAPAEPPQIRAFPVIAAGPPPAPPV